MNAQEFCYWLHGYFELAPDGKLTPEQVEKIKAHLDLVFENVTAPQKGAGSYPPKPPQSSPLIHRPVSPRLYC